MQHPKTRVYEKHALQPGLKNLIYCSNIQRSINSIVRTRAKAHGRTSVSTELPETHAQEADLQASNVCTFWARTPTSPSRKSAWQFGVERLHLLRARVHPNALHKGAHSDCA